MYVATPSGLAEMEETEGVVVDGHLLVVNEYDWKLIWNNIENKVSKCDARTWIACGEWLTRYFDWEFENYKPS
ncbi:hypothetical protein A9Q99_24330 [Gammaproteobacteria bacterium 45_16_T64]|nr:hypothetical protein A9Q99_24330 [Gammaproteobacteria bacterium 45_16_T64]